VVTKVSTSKTEILNQLSTAAETEDWERAIQLLEKYKSFPASKYPKDFSNIHKKTVKIRELRRLLTSNYFPLGEVSEDDLIFAEKNLDTLAVFILGRTFAQSRLKDQIQYMVGEESNQMGQDKSSLQILNKAWETGLIDKDWKNFLSWIKSINEENYADQIKSIQSDAEIIRTWIFFDIEKHIFKFTVQQIMEAKARFGFKVRLGWSQKFNRGKISIVGKTKDVLGKSDLLTREDYTRKTGFTII